MFNKLIDIFAVPIMFLNLCAGIIGGIWLAFLGKWKLIIAGIILFFISNWILSLLMLPGVAIAAAAVLFHKKNNPVQYLFGFLSQFYTNILIIGTCVLAFAICSSFYDGPISYKYIPFLLWSWGMGLGPWQYFASKEPDNEFTAIILFSASSFYLLLFIGIFISPVLGFLIFIAFAIVHLLVLPIVNIKIARNMDN